MTSVEIFKNSKDPKAALITIKVGNEVATMPIGEWSRLISNPQHIAPDKDPA